MDDYSVITNHIYIQEGDTEIGFILQSHKNIVSIETENKEHERFRIDIPLIQFITIVETIKSAAGIGLLK